MIAARCSSNAVAATTGRPSRASAVICRAQAQQTSSRRAMLSAGLMSTAALSLAFVQPARALIPDEEDTEMLEKAKANRRKRLEEQRETTREFLNAEGLENRLLDQELVPVQRLVLDLAKTGECRSGGVMLTLVLLLSLSAPHWPSRLVSVPARDRPRRMARV